MTIYSLNILLFLFGTSLLFHVQFQLLLPDLHTDFSRGRSGGWYSHLFQNFPQFIMIHTVKGFGIVKKAEIDVFLEHPCFIDDPAEVGNLISGSSAFSKTSLNIRKFTVHVLLKPGLEILSITSLVAQSVKHLSTMWETWVRSLGWEVPWRRKWQPTPVILPRKSHGWRSLVSMGSQRVGHD